jgi:hypothetical protein
MKYAHDLSLQTLGYTRIPKVTPRTIASPFNTVNLLHSPIKLMGALSHPTTPTDPPPQPLPIVAGHETASHSYHSPPIASFGPHLINGPNKWVNEADTFLVLQTYHNFCTTTPTPNLVLNCGINRMVQLFALRAEITGTILNAQQVANLCAQPAKSDADPAIPTIEAVDAVYYLTGRIKLYSILFGQSGPLYANKKRCPPLGCPQHQRPCLRTCHFYSGPPLAHHYQPTRWQKR